MKKVLSFIVGISCLAAALLAAESTTSTNNPARRRGTPNSNDVFYTLGPDSQRREGVPQGKYSEAKVLKSNIIKDTERTYWVYVPAQYDPAIPTALMIFHDGHAMMSEPGDVQAHHVLDNLIFRREIPVIIGVFINPGRLPGQPEPTSRDWGDRTANRKNEYDVLDDKFTRVMAEELLPALKKEYNISSDPEQRAVMGASSGAIAAFLNAWHRPDEFRKVISFIGTYTDIKGGHQIPDWVLQHEKKPLRIFLQDGRNDNRNPENLNRDWFHQNVRLAQALTKKGYDLNYTWGIGNHGQKHGGAIFPEMMRWLWRDHPASTDPKDQVERSFRHPKAPAEPAK